MYLALPRIAAGRWGSVGCALRGDSAVPSSSCGPSRPQLGARGGNSLPSSHRRSRLLCAESSEHFSPWSSFPAEAAACAVCGGLCPLPLDFGGAQIPAVSQVGFSLHLCAPGVFHAGSGMPGDMWTLPGVPQSLPHGAQGAPGLWGWAGGGEGMGAGPPSWGSLQHRGLGAQGASRELRRDHLRAGEGTILGVEVQTGGRVIQSTFPLHRLSLSSSMEMKPGMDAQVLSWPQTCCRLGGAEGWLQGRGASLGSRDELGMGSKMCSGDGGTCRV